MAATTEKRAELLDTYAAAAEAKAERTNKPPASRAQIAKILTLLERELAGAEFELSIAREAINDPFTSIEQVDALSADLQRREDRVRDLSNLLKRARRMRALS